MNQWQTIHKDADIVTIRTLAVPYLVLVDYLCTVGMNIIFLYQIDVLFLAIVALQGLDEVGLDGSCLVHDALALGGYLCLEETAPFIIGEVVVIQFLQFYTQIADEFILIVYLDIFITLTLKLLDERTLYDNPAVSLSTEDMARYARKIWLTSSRYSRKSKKHKVQMQLNNIYAVGEYFFLDFSVYNKTNIRFDIDQLRIKLQDKKKAKATTVQTIELEPAFMLDRSQSFLHGYRNVIVIKKLTFPDDKILTIELSEKQISGRTISLTVKYSDVLNADAFSRSLK